MSDTSQNLDVSHSKPLKLIVGHSDCAMLYPLTWLFYFGGSISLRCRCQDGEIICVPIKSLSENYDTTELSIIDGGVVTKWRASMNMRKTAQNVAAL